MKKLPLLLILFLVGLLMAPSAARAEVQIVELSNGNYSCTREAATTFNRDVDKLVEDAKGDAAAFCARKGRQPKFVSITVDKPWPTLGVPKAVVVFKALEPGDPALANATPVPVVRRGKKGKPAASEAATTAAGPVDELYTALLKLDELRAKGLLTEEEFQVQKKNVLERSK